MILIKGKKVPITGRICMKQLIIDVSGNSDVMVEDEVVAMGEEKGEKITDQTSEI